MPYSRALRYILLDLRLNEMIGIVLKEKKRAKGAQAP